jgi:hypothetical protein
MPGIGRGLAIIYTRKVHLGLYVFIYSVYGLNMPVKNLRIPKDGEKNDSGVPFSNNPADKSLAPELANIAGAPMPRFCGC